MTSLLPGLASPIQRTVEFYEMETQLSGDPGPSLSIDYQHTDNHGQLHRATITMDFAPEQPQWMLFPTVYTGGANSGALPFPKYWDVVREGEAWECTVLSRTVLFHWAATIDQQHVALVDCQPDGSDPRQIDITSLLLWYAMITDLRAVQHLPLLNASFPAMVDILVSNHAAPHEADVQSLQQQLWHPRATDH